MGACRSLSSSRGLPLVDVQFTADCITLVIINGRERCFCINFMLAFWAILVQTCDETSVFFRLLLWFPSLILVENGRSLMTQCYLLKPYFFLTLGFALLAWLFFCNATQDWHSAAVSIEPQKCWVFFPAAGDLRTYASLVRRVEAEFVGPPNVRKTHPLSPSEDPQKVRKLGFQKWMPFFEISVNFYRNYIGNESRSWYWINKIRKENDLSN